MLNFYRLRIILGLLIVFSILMWPFYVKGPTLLWAWGPLHVSRESILYGIAVGLRLASFVGTGLILLSTTRNEELTNGLIRMGLPHPVKCGPHTPCADIRHTECAVYLRSSIAESPSRS